METGMHLHLKCKTIEQWMLIKYYKPICLT